MMPSLARTALFSSLSLGLIAPPAVRAATADAAAGNESPITLSPFAVNADADVGYLAANTLAGSRMNTSLKDTAATIDVMTSEFLNDVKATNLTEALMWGNNIQQDLADTAAIGAAGNDNTFFQVGPSFRIRGISATLMRNYLAWRLPIDNYNIDRIEESHGPNSILFGIGSAGGVINVATKQAVTRRSFRRAEGTIGSYGGYRGTIDVNQSGFHDRFGVRVNAVYDHEGDFHTYGYTNTRRVDVAAQYKVTPATTLRLDYETGDGRDNITSYGLMDGLSTWISAGRPTYAAPVAANAATGVGRYSSAARVTYIANNNTVINMASRNFGTTNGAVLLNSALAIPAINGGGPGQMRYSDFSALTAVAEQRFGSNTFLELSYTHQEQNARLYRLASGDTDGGALSFDPDQTLATGATNPYSARLMLDANWQRVRKQFRGDFSRATLSHEEDFGAWGKYRLAGMAEYDFSVAGGGSDVEAWAGSPFNASPENAANLVYRRNYVTEGDWSTYYHQSPLQTGLISGLVDPVSKKTLSSAWVRANAEAADPTKQTTLLLAGQAYYLQDRLVLGFGLRKDTQDLKLRSTKRNPVTNEFETDWTKYDTDSTTSGHTSTFGAVGHLTKNVSFIYNQSNSFNLPASTLILPDSQPGGNPVSKDHDLGLAFTLFDGRLYARTVYFKTSTAGTTAAHGFGSNTTSPAKLTSNVYGALVAQGLLTQAQADAHIVKANGISFDRESDGYEVNLVGTPTPNWRIQLNYSYTNSAEQNIGLELYAWAAKELPYMKSFPQTIVSGSQTIGQLIAAFEDAMMTQAALAGVDVGGNRKQKVNVFTRYTFTTGPLRNAFIGGGYLHQSKTVAGEVTSVGPFLYGRSYWQATAVAGYVFHDVPVFHDLRLQLNVNNLFDDRAPLVTSVFSDGTIRRALPLAPRTWRLSASVEF